MKSTKQRLLWVVGWIAAALFVAYIALLALVSQG